MDNRLGRVYEVLENHFKKRVKEKLKELGHDVDVAKAKNFGEHPRYFGYDFKLTDGRAGVLTCDDGEYILEWGQRR